MEKNTTESLENPRNPTPTFYGYVPL